MKGGSNGTEAHASHGKEIFGKPDLFSQDGRKALLVDCHQPSFVFEESVLAFSKYRDKLLVIPREADNGLDEGADAVTLARAAGLGNRVANHRQYLLEYLSEKRFLAIEIPVEHAV